MAHVDILLDTHTLLWWWAQHKKLSPMILARLRDPTTVVAVSAASAWEVATKWRIGKYPPGGRIVKEWRDRTREDGFVELPVTTTHALRAGTLPGEHRDPFDRMLTAQSICENVPIASNDESLSALGAQRLWQ